MGEKSQLRNNAAHQEKYKGKPVIKFHFFGKGMEEAEDKSQFLGNKF